MVVLLLLHEASMAKALYGAHLDNLWSRHYGYSQAEVELLSDDMLISISRTRKNIVRSRTSWWQPCYARAVADKAAGAVAALLMPRSVSTIVARPLNHAERATSTATGVAHPFIFPTSDR